jgi:hypothetical protein
MFQILSNFLHESDDLGHMMNEHMMFWPFDLNDAWIWLLMMGYSLIVFLLTIWTYKDAKLQGENALLWTFVVFFTMGIGILPYSLKRQPNIVVEPKISEKQNMQGTTPFIGSFCESCGNELEKIDLFCAKCGTAV